MVSLGAGPLGVWRSEEVDVLADYRARFGAPVPPVVAVAVMSDSDNSCQAAEAYLARFRFGAGTEGLAQMTDRAFESDRPLRGLPFRPMVGVALAFAGQP
jgi:hypothetical protein